MQDELTGRADGLQYFPRVAEDAPTMPFYEFYCEDCHTLFNFYSRRVNTEKRPACPRCARPEITRKVSIFAISKGRAEADGGEDLPDLDEERLERAFGSMAGELEGLDEEDPRAAARAMRRLFDATGLRLGAGMEEAMRRMEAGEDPEQVEAELGDVLESEDPFGARGRIGLADVKDVRALRRMLPPRVDPELHEL